MSELRRALSNLVDAVHSGGFPHTAIARAEAVLENAPTGGDELLERLCQQVREVGGLSTGHADTPEQLMAEVLEQVKEAREKVENLRVHCAAESVYWEGVARNAETESLTAEKAKSLSAAYRQMGNRVALPLPHDNGGQANG